MQTDKNTTYDFFYETADAVQNIALPLKQHFNTSYLNFVRRFDDGTEACLTTDPEWTRFFYETKLYKHLKVDKIFIDNEYLANKIKIIPWEQFTDSPVRIAQSERFGIGVGISIFFIRSGYADFFHFGTANENKYMNRIYANFSDCLLRYTHYFYDQAGDLIDQACLKENRLQFKDRDDYRHAIAKEDDNTLDINRFLKATKPKCYMVHGDNETTYISFKEIQCIKLAATGMSAPQIGGKLFLSHRTVESHIKNVRQKIGLPSGATKANVIDQLIAFGFDLHRVLPSSQD